MKKLVLLFIMLRSLILMAEPSMQRKLLLSETIYAVAGSEVNVYFDNVFLSIHPENFAFEVKCMKGRCDEKRWSFIPKNEDVGEYEWSLKVYDDDGKVAEGKVRLAVVSSSAGAGKKITLLLIGDSETELGHCYPTHIFELFQGKNQPSVRMIGENGPGWPAVKDVRHEGYGGWSWAAFIGRGGGQSNPKAARQRINPFWNPEKEMLDFPAYFKKNNGGHAPDFISINLGTNDTFLQTDEDIDSRLERIMGQAKTFLADLRKAAPDATIGIAQIFYCSSSQDAFGNNYGCLQNRWQVKKSQFAYNRALIKTLKEINDPKIVVVPLSAAIDLENNVRYSKGPVNFGNKENISRQCNGLHPAPAGYNQAAEAFYAWLKYQLK